MKENTAADGWIFVWCKGGNKAYIVDPLVIIWNQTKPLISSASELRMHREGINWRALEQQELGRFIWEM